MSNVSSLSDLRKKEDKDKEEKKGDEFFAGGLDQRGGGSGLAVVGPDGGRGGGSGRGDMFDSLVEKASQGSDLSASASASSDSNSNSTVITLYRNGFTVNDGRLRDLTSPENVAFLSSLLQGRIPQELGGDSRAGTIDVALVDKRGEDYIAPAYVAFSGPASTLRIAGSGSDGATTAFVFTADAISRTQPPVTDESQPCTTLQVRTAQGKKLRLKVNNAATVMQLAALIVREVGGGVGASFTLSAGFPPQAVKDASQSIEDAGLKGAAVTQQAV